MRTAAYPAPLEALQLRAIATMREAFGLPVGLSDHSRDPVVAPVAAVALGAVAIEKHFTLSNDLPGPDHRFALEPSELEVMVRAIRDTEAALGDGRKTTEPAERELHGFARRAIFATAEIATGAEFTRSNVAVLRCGKLDHGLAPRELPAVLGRRASRNLVPDAPIPHPPMSPETDLAAGWASPGQLELAIRPAEAADAELLWRWVNDPGVRKASFRRDPIDWNDHVAWFGNRLESQTNRIYVLEENGAPAAQVRFDLGESDAWEIDVGVDPGRRGRGIGAEAVTSACAELFADTGATSIVARVKRANIPSLRMFAKSGFVEEGDDESDGVAHVVLRRLHPAVSRRYVVAGQRPWNRQVFDERIAELPGSWTFLDDPVQLTPELLAVLDPRYVFFLHWSAIVPPSITDAFTCIGFHMTDLPYGRGGSPLQNLIVRGHRETKLSAFAVERGIDTGPIYAKAELALDGTAQEIYVRSSNPRERSDPPDRRDGARARRADW